MTLARADVDDDVVEMTSAMTSAGDPAARERVVNLRRNFCRRMRACGTPDDADSSPMM